MRRADSDKLNHEEECASGQANHDRGSLKLRCEHSVHYDIDHRPGQERREHIERPQERDEII